MNIIWGNQGCQLKLDVIAWSTEIENMIGPTLWELTRPVWRNSIDFRWEGSLFSNCQQDESQISKSPSSKYPLFPILAQNEANSRKIMRIIYRAVQRLFTKQCGAVMLAALPRLTTARASELRYRSGRQQRSAGCNKFSVFNILGKYIVHLGEIANWRLLEQVSSDIESTSTTRTWMDQPFWEIDPWP